MNVLEAAILGLVEGITEYLPVSSTGHLILTSAALGLSDGPEKDSVHAFEVVIQAGAILAVVGLYWPRFVRMLRGLLGRDAGGLRLLTNLVIAFVPAAAIGFLLHDWITSRLFYPAPVAGALVIGGAYMLGVDRWKRVRTAADGPGKTLDEMGPREALIVGLFQIGSLWPGTSRSMMTITGGYFAGLRPVAAAEFSFLLGVPILMAAAGYSLVKNLVNATPENPPFYEALGVWPTAVGLIVATLSAAVAVKFLIAVLQRKGLTPFGWYRIVVGVVFLTLVYAGRI